MDMNDDENLLEVIEENISNLYGVQEKVNMLYESIDGENYVENYNMIVRCLYEEKDLINAIRCNLDKYFDINSRWWWNRFRIVEDVCARYIIKPPLRLDKSTWKYTLLKKLLVRLHNKYFLSDGRIGYAFSSVESHMWEIPNFIKENELIMSIRKRNDLKKP